MESEVVQATFIKHTARLKRAISRLLLGVVVFISPFSNAELKDEYLMGVEKQDYAPYFYWQDGEYRGYSRELFDMFEKFANVKIGYRPYRVNELYGVLKEGTVDLKYPDSPSWQHAKKMGKKWYYSNRVAPYIDGSLVRVSELSLRLDSLNTLGSITGFTPWGYHYLVQEQKLKLETVKDVSSLLDMLVEHRVDAVYANVSVLNYYVKKNKPSSINKIRFNPNLPYTKNSYFVSTISHIDFIEKLDEFLLEKTSQIHVLKIKYGLHKIDGVLNR